MRKYAIIMSEVSAYHFLFTKKETPFKYSSGSTYLWERQLNPDDILRLADGCLQGSVQQQYPIEVFAQSDRVTVAQQHFLFARQVGTPHPVAATCCKTSHSFSCQTVMFTFRCHNNYFMYFTFSDIFKCKIIFSQTTTGQQMPK